MAAIELGRGLGHIRRVEAICRALRRAGHKVVLVTNDVAVAHDLDGGAFDQVECAPVLNTAGDLAPTFSLAQIASWSGFSSAERLSGLVRLWEELFKRLRPQLLLCEHAPVALAAAWLNDVPVQRIGNGFIVPPASGFENLRPWVACDAKVLQSHHCAVDMVLEELGRRYGMSKIPNYQGLYAASPSILATWPETDHAAARSGEVYFGPLTEPTAAGFEPAQRGKMSRAFVYMPLGNAKAQVVLKALVELKWPAIWYGGRDCREQVIGRVAIVSRPLSIGSVVGNDTVVIYRAGHGLSCDVLRLGAKPVLVPDTVESSLLAYRLQSRGLAMVLPSAVDPSTIRSGLERIGEVDFNRDRRAEVVEKCRNYDARSTCDRLVSQIDSVHAPTEGITGVRP